MLIKCRVIIIETFSNLPFYFPIVFFQIETVFAWHQMAPLKYLELNNCSRATETRCYYIVDP